MWQKVSGHHCLNFQSDPTRDPKFSKWDQIENKKIQKFFKNDRFPKVITGIFHFRNNVFSVITRKHRTLEKNGSNWKSKCSIFFLEKWPKFPYFRKSNFPSFFLKLVIFEKLEIFRPSFVSYLEFEVTWCK